MWVSRSQTLLLLARWGILPSCCPFKPDLYWDSIWSSFWLEGTRYPFRRPVSGDMECRKVVCTDPQVWLLLRQNIHCAGKQGSCVAGKRSTLQLWWTWSWTTLGGDVVMALMQSAGAHWVARDVTFTSRFISWCCQQAPVPAIELLCLSSLPMLFYHTIKSSTCYWHGIKGIQKRQEYELHIIIKWSPISYFLQR